MMETYYTELLRDGVPEKLPSSDFNFLDLFDEHIANNQKTWKQDRRLTVGASECFACIRSNFFKKRGHLEGFEPDPHYKESWGAMERGNIIENNYVVPAIEDGLRRRGMDIIMHGDGQDTILDGVHSATLDGLVINCPSDVLACVGIPDIKTDCFVLEIKSNDPRMTIEKEKEIHYGQTQMQMGLVRDTTEYQPEYAVVIYVNASWLDDIRPFAVKFDAEAYQAGRDRNTKVFEEKDPSTFSPEGKMDDTCQYCQYTIACGKVTKDRVPEKTTPLNKAQITSQNSNFIGSLNPLVAEYLEARDIAKASEKNKKLLGEKIQQELIGVGESRAVGDDWKVSYTAIGGKNTLSKAKMVECGLDPDDYMAQGNPYEKLTIATFKESDD